MGTRSLRSGLGGHKGLFRPQSVSFTCARSRVVWGALNRARSRSEYVLRRPHVVPFPSARSHGAPYAGGFGGFIASEARRERQRRFYRNRTPPGTVERPFRCHRPRISQSSTPREPTSRAHRRLDCPLGASARRGCPPPPSSRSRVSTPPAIPSDARNHPWGTLKLPTDRRTHRAIA